MFRKHADVFVDILVELDNDEDEGEGEQLKFKHHGRALISLYLSQR